MTDDSVKENEVSEEKRNIQLRCNVCQRPLVVDGLIEAHPRYVMERFRKVGGPLLNAQGQQQVEIPIVCPDNNECYRGALDLEGFQKASAQVTQEGPPRIQPPSRRN